jgi:hypothetical protein
MPEYDASYISFELSRGAPPPGGTTRIRVNSETGESGWLEINEEQYSAILTILTTPSHGWRGYRIKVGREVLAVVARDLDHAFRIVSDLRPGAGDLTDVTGSMVTHASQRPVMILLAISVIVLTIVIIVTNIVTST